MEETVTIRFGMISAREVELEVDAHQDVAEAFALAMGAGEAILWITDLRGHRYGVVLDKVAFLEVEKARPREVGFGPV